MNPIVSVITPFYNTEKYVETCIRSILSQSLSDFELILIDDASTDDGLKRVKKYSDPRIRVICNAQNQGLARVRNIGLEAATGKYIAFLDADDFSHPMRLKRQVDILEKNPTIGLCGSWVRTVGKKINLVIRHHADPEWLRCAMIFHPPVATSSAMFRREIIQTNNLRFDLEYPPAEDYEFWVRLTENAEVTNVQQVLTYYRHHPGQSTRASDGKTRQYASEVRIKRRLFAAFGFEVSDKEMEIHQKIGVGRAGYSQTYLDDLQTWLYKIEKHNLIVKHYPARVLSGVLGRYWFEGCKAATELGMDAWFAYQHSRLKEFYDPGMADIFRIWSKSLLKWA